MSKKIIQLNEEVIEGQLKGLVCGSVEETLNELLEAETEKLTQAAWYEPRRGTSDVLAGCLVSTVL
jgi:putative transposase